MMKKIAFLGLGRMGGRMAGNLVRNGFSVVVWNRSMDKAQELIELGAEIAATPAAAAAAADITITMLSQDHVVREVLLGKNGVIEEIAAGKLVIDCSTVAPGTSRDLYREFEKKGADFLDAPVTGSVSQAEDGTLVFMVGGRREAFERAGEVFDSMGKHKAYMGECGAGATTKLANNTIAAINLFALAEGMSIAEKSGIDLEDFAGVISGGAAQSRMVDRKAQKLIARDYSPQFTAALMNKDLGLAAGLCMELGINASLLEFAKETLQKAVDEGNGEKDFSVIYELYRKNGGF
ncbi:MAG TPA: NAD(P)-dependent oxidoreductase [Negativicutes bacterium]|nr:NAD(P)-dependent oxidoreductase [Negativicutes bacterium]